MHHWLIKRCLPASKFQFHFNIFLKETHIKKPHLKINSGVAFKNQETC